MRMKTPKWKPLPFKWTKCSCNLQWVCIRSKSHQSYSGRCTCERFTSCQSSSLLSERSSSDTWAQKAAISFSSPAQVMPQLFSTSTLGRLSRSETREKRRRPLVTVTSLSRRSTNRRDIRQKNRSPSHPTIYTQSFVVYSLSDISSCQNLCSSPGICWCR